MLSLKQTKKLLRSNNYYDDEVAQIRDEMRDLAELIFEKYQQDRKRKNSE